MALQLVLVVDDEEAVCDIIVDALHLAEYRTIRAADGATALTLMREEHPDLVILDVNMPRMTGFEVLERMRKADIMTTIREKGSLPDGDALERSNLISFDALVFSIWLSLMFTTKLLLTSPGPNDKTPEAVE